MSSNASPYTLPQLQEYLSFISVPEWMHPCSEPPPVLDLRYLTTLHTHQITSIPYENLSLHYSKSKTVSLDAQELYNKFISRKRGGYCLELSLFYHYILRALGFQVYIAPVRIRLRRGTVPEGGFIGWRHIVNVVYLPSNGGSYMVDVGFGGDGATAPLAMIHDQPQHNLGTQYIRLIHDTIPEQQDRGHSKRLWIYQYRNSADVDWNSYYAFPEVEFTPIDLEIMNHYLCTHEGSFQRFIVLAIKFLRTGDRVTGKVMLVDNQVKQNLGGKTELLQELQSEGERLTALDRWFGLKLTEEEIASIEGHWSQISAPAPLPDDFPLSEEQAQ